MIRYRTKSGSLYEQDQENKRIRCIEGAGRSKRLGGANGGWREYQECSLLDGRLIIVWGTGRDEVSDELGTPDDLVPMRMTETSRVVEVTFIEDV